MLSCKKSFNPDDELIILDLWEKERVSERISPEKPLSVIDTPPPYVTGPMHVGNSAHYAQIDMVARYLRMKGLNVFFPLGFDRNGLPVELIVEKAIRKRAAEVPREEFIEECRRVLDEYEKVMARVLKRLGLSCNFEKCYRTDSPEYRGHTQAIFIDLWKRSLIYESEAPVNWCPSCVTTIADAEVEKKKDETPLYYVVFRVLETNESIEIATTRPELLGACRAVIYNPDDVRYQHLKDKHVEIPIYGEAVPVFPHSYARPEFGSGLVMLCSYGDQSDIRLFRELNLKPNVIVDEDGRLNEKSIYYAGLTVEEAKKRAISNLKAKNLITKEERMIREVPICWRCGTKVEYIHRKEFYLKQLEFLDKIREIARGVTFFPEKHRKILESWINSLTTDWPISRERFYGTEIPIWYCKECGKPHVPPPGKYYLPWKEKPPIASCACGSTEFVGETRTLDTWVDSSITPLYLKIHGAELGYENVTTPLLLRPQGVDIVRTWLYYTLLIVFHQTGLPAFKSVRLSGMGLDAFGRPMHRHLGNVVYCEDIISKYGADSFRLWSASEVKLGSDYRFFESHVMGARKFITKLWNLAKFVSRFPFPEKLAEMKPLDLAILELLDDLIEKVTRFYSETDFFEGANSTRNFTWGIFADHYVELIKHLAYSAGPEASEQVRSRWYVLHYTLITVIKLLAPIIPFTTEAIWRSFYSKDSSIHFERFPQPLGLEKKYSPLIPMLIKFNSTIWMIKKSSGLSLNSEIDTVYAPVELSCFAEEIQSAHRIRTLRFGKPEAPEAMIAAPGEVYVKI